MTIQFIQKRTVTIVLAILTALYEGLSRLGCGMAGIAYEEHTTLGP
jgi:hypothetical protein